MNGEFPYNEKTPEMDKLKRALVLGLFAIALGSLRIRVSTNKGIMQSGNISIWTFIIDCIPIKTAGVLVM